MKPTPSLFGGGFCLPTHYKTAKNTVHSKNKYENSRSTRSLHKKPQPAIPQLDRRGDRNAFSRRQRSSNYCRMFSKDIRRARAKRVERCRDEGKTCVRTSKRRRKDPL